MKTTSTDLKRTLLIATEAFKSMNFMDDGEIIIANCIHAIHLFDDVEDKRDPSRIEYKLSDLLLMILISILGNQSGSYLQMAQYIKVHAQMFRDVGLLQNTEHTPSHDSIRRILMTIKPEDIQDITLSRLQTFLNTLEKATSDSKYRVLNIDGKDMRGTGRSTTARCPSRNVELLNVYDTSSGLCLCSVHVDTRKENEIPVAQEILSAMNLRNCIITADALHCQKETTSIIRSSKGNFVLTVKDNQQLLNQEISARIQRDAAKVITVKRNNRVFKILILPKGYSVDGFIGTRAFVNMKSCMHDRKNPTERNFITSLINPELICECIEERWEVENQLHKSKDVTLNEDRVTYTDRNATRAIALINNMAYSVMSLYRALAGIDTLSETKLWFSSDPILCCEKLLTVMQSEELTNRVIEQMKKPRRSPK